MFAMLPATLGAEYCRHFCPQLSRLWLNFVDGDAAGFAAGAAGDGAEAADVKAARGAGFSFDSKEFPLWEAEEFRQGVEDDNLEGLCFGAGPLTLDAIVSAQQVLCRNLVEQDQQMRRIQ